MLDVEVLDDPAVATAALDPLRSRLLDRLRQPGSASSVASDLGETRQKVNYHLRTLERLGLVRQVGTRQRRGLTERLVEASAGGYVVSPAALGDAAADPTRTDRLSSAYLIAVAARLVREVGQLASAADRAGKPLATLTIDTEVRFASAHDRAAFTAELADAVATLAARYHDDAATGGRSHRLVVASHPSPAPSTDPTTEEPRP